MLEEVISELPAAEKYEIEFKPFEIKTFKVTY